MRAGGLRKHTIDIQSNIETINEFGERIRTWTTTITTKSDVLFESGTGTMKHGEVFTDYKVGFRIRKYHQVDETMRIIFEGKKYKIEAVIPNYEKSMTLIKTTKIND